MGENIARPGRRPQVGDHAWVVSISRKWTEGHTKHARPDSRPQAENQVLVVSISRKWTERFERPLAPHRIGQKHARPNSRPQKGIQNMPVPRIGFKPMRMHGSHSFQRNE